MFLGLDNRSLVSITVTSNLPVPSDQPYNGPMTRSRSRGERLQCCALASHVLENATLLS